MEIMKNLYKMLFLWFFILVTNSSNASSPVAVDSKITQLNVPWAIDFLTSDEIIATERSGKILFINLKNKSVERISINEVVGAGEGGLLGITRHPNFDKNRWIYVYYTYLKSLTYFNKVVRFEVDHHHFINPVVILDRIPASWIHDGGQIKFGPDGFLYITTGDANQPNDAQDLNSLAGKILRVKEDGSVPSTNPFLNSPVFSYGHRNPQGIAWDSQGNLWETEHGSSARDEINLIQSGKNYGWPIIQGNEKKEGMISPILQSGTETWAPSGADIKNDKLYFAGLRGQSLYEFDLKIHQLKKYFFHEFGRLRSVKLGPDGKLYVTTSNRDGRGRFHEGDDFLLQIAL